ncbi:putative DNA-binding domain-containing protein [Alphaproteobacteria bacterium KMM 3653]|uniref:DNA-binding domain-containing protein n=1 Tax=Harenicola maris TaxID=2841044 RepID=A0AAP2CM21_9RHOB|nr:putative DNA-binding domain-containing protein [Harenicola maris]
MTVNQSQFTRALLNPEAAVPDGLINPGGTPATKRFNVYRNNVAVSLSNALAEAFPVVQKLVGTEFFTAMAGVFLRQHPPESPLIALYGQAMEGFLRGFGPAQSIPYLPDIARLELALRQSYHAADTAPADVTVLQNMAPDALMQARLTLAPAVQLIGSDWPIHSIYIANTQANAPKPQMQAQDVLITRPEFDPLLHLLPAGGHGFISALASGAPFGAAIEATQTDDFDLTTTLGLLISGNAITSID